MVYISLFSEDMLELWKYPIYLIISIEEKTRAYSLMSITSIVFKLFMLSFTLGLDIYSSLTLYKQMVLYNPVCDPVTIREFVVPGLENKYQYVGTTGSNYKLTWVSSWIYCNYNLTNYYIDGTQNCGLITTNCIIEKLKNPWNDGKLCNYYFDYEGVVSTNYYPSPIINGYVSCLFNITMPQYYSYIGWNREANYNFYFTLYCFSLSVILVAIVQFYISLYSNFTSLK